MFSKNNLKFIFILALGFFGYYSLYLSEESYLLDLSQNTFDKNSILLYTNLSMALGIWIFSFLYRKKRNVKKIYFINIILSIMVTILFFVTQNMYVMIICMCMMCALGTGGFGAGYHLSLVSSNIKKEYRGRGFALGFGVGGLLTYLFIILGANLFSSYGSCYIYVLAMFINLFLVYRNTDLLKTGEQKLSLAIKKRFLIISLILLTMSFLTALSSYAMTSLTSYVVGYDTKIYYLLGLLLAGLLIDKKNNLFEVLVIISFIASLLNLVLLKDGYYIGYVSSAVYFFVAFFVLFRIMTCINLVDYSTEMVYVAGFGLMYSKIMVGLSSLFANRLIDNYVLLMVTIFICFSLVIILYFMLYFQKEKDSEKDIVRKLSIKYNLTNQEEKVLQLLVRGLNNQEIADDLFISVFTVKRHVASIYKKTSMNKKELVEECFIRTR